MAKKVFDDYYLGLDIGTDSVGWAVTDKNYNILNFNGKAMWGIHLFDKGNTAEERRTHRAARRRLERRKQRISLLQEIFKEEMNKTDPFFFERLNESRFVIEDRKHKNHDTLFNDPSFKDRDLFKKYPTIYHLRYDLMQEQKEKPDIRLLYLACHHILKYRGHFLFEGLSSNAIPEFEQIFEKMIESLNQECGTEIEADSIGNDVKAILCDKRLGVKEKKIELLKVLQDNEHPDVVKELCGLIAGGTANLKNMFAAGEEEIELGKLTFKNTDFEEERTKLENEISDPDKIEILDNAKAIYDWALLSDLIGEYKSISKAKIAGYKQHEEDLIFLKSILKDNPEKYKEVFKSESKTLNNYPAYSGSHRKNATETNFCTQSDFCKHLKNIFKNFNQPEFVSDSEYEDMMKRIEDETYMPKQTNKDNSLFPNALHIMELKSILENASVYYPFLIEKEEDNLSGIDKITKMGTFRIPYYVGPLQNNPKTNRAWMVRKEDGRITPWNFESKVDLDESAHEFMHRLIGNCTYLKTEKVVPKASLMYQRYMLYNELNPLKINGERLFELNPNLKSEIVRDLFENPASKKVTKKGIENYLKKRNLLHKDDEIKMAGVDDEIKASLKSEIQLKAVLGSNMDLQMAEEIIKTLTVFGNEKSRIRDKLKKDYADKLTDEQIEKILNLRFKDWGRLSEKFLKGIYASVNGSEKMNILEALENTSLNLMELLSSDYEFKKQIDKLNEADIPDGQISYNLVEDLYASPSVKRGIWRSLRIIEDILKVTGHPPTKVFIETTREHQESKRTVSRKTKLLKLYESCKKENNEIIGLLDGLKNEDESRLRSKALYAYYTQQGKCMYCGKKIDLNDIWNVNLYDLDHIHPRSLKMDDSVHNNLVLVCKKENMEKSDNYPLPAEWQNRMGSFWRGLKECELITPEKYERLVRTKPFEEDELSGFINRQLVETSQSVKAVAETMKKIFGDKTDVVYVKANAVSDFRNGNNGFHDSNPNGRLKFVKCRSVNDYHHAKDAYLNIIVGNVYDTKFTQDYKKFVKSGEKYNFRKMFDNDVERNGVHAWTAGNDGTIATVQKYMRRNNILFTRFAYEEKKALFDLNPLKKGKGQLPLKKGLSIKKYGGYNNLAGSYFSLVEHTKNKKRIRIIYPVLTCLVKQNMDDSELIKYMETDGLENPQLLLQKILKFSTFEIDGFRLHIASRTGTSFVYYNAEQLILAESDYEYCKKVDNYITKSKETKNSLSAENYGLTFEGNKNLYQILLGKYKGKKYGIFFETISKTLEEKSNIFESLSADEQTKVLGQLLHGFQCNASYPNLELIGGPKLTGRIQKSNNIANFDSIKLIHQSPSGLFEKETDLKEL